MLQFHRLICILQLHHAKTTRKTKGQKKQREKGEFVINECLQKINEKVDPNNAIIICRTKGLNLFQQLILRKGLGVVKAWICPSVRFFFFFFFKVNPQESC